MINDPVLIDELKHDAETSFSSAELEAAYIEDNNRRMTEAVDDVLGSESMDDLDLMMDCVSNSDYVPQKLRQIFSVDVSKPLREMPLKEVQHLYFLAYDLVCQINAELQDYVDVPDE